MKSHGWLLLGLCACGDDGNGGTHQDASSVDGRRVDASIDAPVFSCATSPSTGTHKIYLSFEGVTLSAGSASDATTNTVPYLDSSVTSATIAQWKASAGDRQMQIDSILCAIREAYYLFDVEFVTTRPASGDYEMVVFGGQPSDLGYNLGSSTGMGALAANDCSTTNVRDVVWIAEHPINNNAFTPTAIQSGVLASAFLAAGNALAASKVPGNCTCSLPSSDMAQCVSSMACSFSDASPIPLGGAACQNTSPENQNMKLTSRYGARQF